MTASWNVNGLPDQERCPEAENSLSNTFAAQLLLPL